jgi:PTS system fructose-specific IIA component/PTS system nitrogen regulatory IIA component
MKITDFISRKRIIVELRAKNKKQVIAELVRAIKKEVSNPKFQVTELTGTILEREKLGSTGIGRGVAVPHTRTPLVKEVIGAFGRSVSGVDFDAIDAEKVQLFFLILSPESGTDSYQKALAAVMNTIRKPNISTFLKNAKSAKEIEDIFRETEEAINV